MPYQYPEKLIPVAVTSLLDGRPVPLYGDGRHVREWIHVADHARGVQAAAERGVPGAVHHLRGGTRLTNLAVVRRLLAALGADGDRVVHVADRKGHDRRYALAPPRAPALEWAPRVPFDEGLAETVAWYAARRDWWEPLRKADAPLEPGRTAR